MKVLILVLLCVAVAHARWSVYSSGNQVESRQNEGHDDMDWWEHAVFYQVNWKKIKLELKLNENVSPDLPEFIQRQ